MANMCIRDYRKAAGLTQTALADEIGVTQSIISDWENDVYLPNARQLPMLAKVLGCQIGDLFIDDDPAGIKSGSDN
jgi:transcriptional regulator with XRE-family HTH domain